MTNERFLKQIVSEADNVARLYLAGKRLGQPATREQKEIIEGILAADYEGRTLVELLQNGHDAHDPGRTDGMLEFWLAEDEGEHGVLYAANAGEPLKDENFTALCRIAMSPKRPDQGIGNKGVGFKSVLQLSHAPEIYSAADGRRWAVRRVLLPFCLAGGLRQAGRSGRARPGGPWRRAARERRQPQDPGASGCCPR